ncbi:hypothetical protein [Actinomadura chibensis]|uniref:Uncharacterized protein n=1 Tax=Actinomadura chibensis TaxID=392828 RepID=A0A5D0N9C8_9ACTN|nr:hypothetical protein [Actinomadura chibensis]TYB40815.1 hypothetical protein FXF69_38000 [Actinomadura chibensis]
MTDQRINERVGEMLAVLQLGLCGRCGRASYETRRTARHAARIVAPGVRLRAYRCGSPAGSQAWHLTSVTGHRQHITPPVTLPRYATPVRASLDRRGPDERAYPRPGTDADQCGAADVSGRRGSPDPLEEAHDTDPLHSGVRYAEGPR